MPEKLDHLQHGLKNSFHGEGVTPAWVAEMDFGLAPAIAEALHTAVDRGLTGYPYPKLEEACADAAVSFWADRFEWSPDSTWVHAAPDVIAGCRRAIELLTRPGSPVVVHSPVYFPFYNMISDAGRDVVEVISQVSDEGRYTLNLDGIGRAFDEGAGSIVLCSPWNPTGRSFSRDEIDAVCELARHHEARVIADEVHAALTFEAGTHTAAATVDPETVVTVTAASKAWNLPGLKCAQLVLSNEADRDKWVSHFTPDRVGVSTLGLVASEAAYRDGGAWLDEVMVRLDSNAALLGDLINEHLPDLSYRRPEATYLTWLDFAPYHLTEPAEFLLSQAGVALTAGGPFGSGAESFARLNFATHPETLVELCERMGKVLHKM